MADPWSGTQWLVRLRGIGVLPDESDGRVGGAPADLQADNAVMPELDFTYFFTDNIAAELILATTPHDVTLAGAKISEIWVLPPTLTIQYHHSMGALKPYAGVGVNYTRIISSDATAAIGGVDDWDDSFGIALQAGFDYAIDDRWSLNVDVKKLFLELEADVTPARVPASVDLDPWIVGIGVGYRF
jgi:outer membrane protein